MSYGQPPPPLPFGVPCPVAQEFIYQIPVSQDADHPGHRTTLYPIRSGMVNVPFEARSGVVTWHGAMTLVTTNPKALWIRGDHATATGTYLTRFGWSTADYEELDLPRECDNQLNLILSGASQWST
jgi:hypothetical protein